MNDVEKRAEDLIARISAVSEHLPGVVIIHDLRTMTVVYMSQRGLDILGTTLDDLKKLGPEYFTYYFHPDDSSPEKIFRMILGNNTYDVFTMFQQVMEARPAGDCEWGLYLTAMKILLKDDADKPILTIATAHPIMPDKSCTDRVMRLFEENSFSKYRKHLFENLSSREKEILTFIAKGYTSDKISKSLCISVETAKTHRKNIRRKLNVSGNHELMEFARAFDLT